MKPTRTWGPNCGRGQGAHSRERRAGSRIDRYGRGSYSMAIIPRRMISCPTGKAEATARAVRDALPSIHDPTPTGISRQSSRTNWRSCWLAGSTKTPTTGSDGHDPLSRDGNVFPAHHVRGGPTSNSAVVPLTSRCRAREVIPMAKLKLTYFDFHGGRGEPARLAMSIGGVAFDDDRVQPSDWERRKADTPFGALPVLEVDGQVVAQSNAINRYVGKLADLYPSDPWQAALCDEVMEAVEDINTKIGATFFLPEEQKKAQRTHWSKARSHSTSLGCNSGSKHMAVSTSPTTA